MSIRTYFENIADAIKNVYGTTDTLTPAEMPEAITNFNSIFQTKNLSAPISGQTTVEGCLSSLSSDLTDLNSNLSVTTLNITPSIGELKVVKTGHIVNVLWGTGGTSQIIPLGGTTLASGLPIPINMYPQEQGSIPASPILSFGADSLFVNSFSVFVTGTGNLQIMNGSNNTSMGVHRGVNITYITNE